MCTLQQRMIVNCSVADTNAMLSALLEERSRMAIRPVLPVPRLGIEIAMRGEVVVMASRLAVTDTWMIEWSPADGGAFPRFVGSLRSAPDDVHADSATLNLDGSYQLSERAMNDDSDRSLAHRIEIAIARTLLGELRHALERTRTGRHSVA